MLWHNKFGARIINPKGYRYKHMQKVLEITTAARQRLIHKGVKNIRIGVKEAGCAGMEYIFDEGVETQTDLVLNHGDFTFLIDTSHMPYIEGMKLDYVRDGIQERFEFDNPKVNYACGCGTSLTFDMTEGEQAYLNNEDQ